MKISTLKRVFLLSLCVFGGIMFFVPNTPSNASLVCTITIVLFVLLGMQFIYTSTEKLQKPWIIISVMVTLGCYTIMPAWLLISFFHERSAITFLVCGLALFSFPEYFGMQGKLLDKNFLAGLSAKTPTNL